MQTRYSGSTLPLRGQSEGRDPGQMLQHRQQRETPVHIRRPEPGPSPSETPARSLHEREEEEMSTSGSAML